VTAPSPLRIGARVRRETWLTLARARAWPFDPAQAYADAVRLLVGRDAAPIDAYLASGLLLDVAEGIGPSGAIRLPASWRALPEPVKCVLGLPHWARVWEDRGRVREADPTMARAVSVAAAMAEADGDEGRRAGLAAIVDWRRKPERLVAK
jgi:hypothetical protein